MRWGHPRFGGNTIPWAPSGQRVPEDRQLVLLCRNAEDGFPAHAAIPSHELHRDWRVRLEHACPHGRRHMEIGTLASNRELCLVHHPRRQHGVGKTVWYHVSVGVPVTGRRGFPTRLTELAESRPWRSGTELQRWDPGAEVVDTQSETRGTDHRVGEIRHTGQPSNATPAPTQRVLATRAVDNSH